MSEIFDIATLGTSLTIGSGSEFSFHRDLLASLRVGKESVPRAYNFGIPGGNTTMGLAALSAALNTKAKAFLIEFLINDCSSGSGGLSQATSTAQTIQILDAIKAAVPGASIFLMTMNPVVGASASATARANLSTYNTIYRDLAVSEDVGLIDSYPAWAGATLSDIPDGVHPTPAANRSYLIPAIASALRPLMS